MLDLLSLDLAAGKNTVSTRSTTLTGPSSRPKPRPRLQAIIN
jgi:hypothetical protein